MISLQSYNKIRKYLYSPSLYADYDFNKKKLMTALDKISLKKFVGEYVDEEKQPFLWTSGNVYTRIAP